MYLCTLTDSPWSVLQSITTWEAPASRLALASYPMQVLIPTKVSVPNVSRIIVYSAVRVTGKNLISSRSTRFMPSKDRSQL